MGRLTISAYRHALAYVHKMKYIPPQDVCASITTISSMVYARDVHT
jgi:hypothetical protein